MSAGIAIKSAEGIVLAADSRVTLNAQMPAPTPGQTIIIPATFDNATKLMRVAGQDFVGVVTYGVGALGTTSPRTAQSLLPEFEAGLAKAHPDRMIVAAFAKELSNFFLDQWKTFMPSNTAAGNDMVFLVGGFDPEAPYGRVFEFYIPSRPEPNETNPGDQNFGMTWGGQREYIDRLLQGFDSRVALVLKQRFNLSDEDVPPLVEDLKQAIGVAVPFAFLPLQDCIDLAIFLIRATISMQSFTVGMRGVGGAIDVAAITRTNGFTIVQQKGMEGERR